MEKRRVLLIAGGGAIGSHTSVELLKLGYQVDVVCLEDHVSDHPDLTFRKERVTDEFLRDYLPSRHYDAIVDFIWYPDPKEYEQRSELLLTNTRHLIFLSSYRVYGDKEHPIRETSPQLPEAYTDEVLLTKDTYGVSKAYEERILRASPYRNWTIIRPVISFSHFRFDLVTQGAATLLPRSRQHKKILLPRQARDLVAGLDWAGNVGKIIAHLVLNEKAFGEDFTITSGQVHTWGEIADYYTEILGSEFVWVDAEDYRKTATRDTLSDGWMLRYDRLLDRRVDNSKVLAATGLKAEDFVPVKEGLRREFTALPESFYDSPQLNSPGALEVNAKIDAYLKAHHLD